MDSNSTSYPVLMSIHPEFAFGILEGTKLVEFRTRATARPASHIVIYATSPVCGVVGVVEVDRVEQASPAHLWKRFGLVGGIARADFFRYFADKTTGVAYVVGRVWVCKQPLRLGTAGLPSVPPQAYQYLTGGVLDTILKKSTLSAGRALTQFAESA